MRKLSTEQAKSLEQMSDNERGNPKQTKNDNKKKKEQKMVAKMEYILTWRKSANFSKEAGPCTPSSKYEVKVHMASLEDSSADSFWAPKGSKVVRHWLQIKEGDEIKIVIKTEKISPKELENWGNYIPIEYGQPKNCKAVVIERLESRPVWNPLFLMLFNKSSS